MSTLVIGGAGAVGTRLVRALAKRGDKIVIADRLPRIPDSLAEKASAVVPNVDVRDHACIAKLFRDHPGVKSVWNLAAPLSVETALSPAVAEAITIGGMKNVINGMMETGVRRLCFTDSIGSFGSTAPRKDCAARWLTENPEQDPGSDYGLQKRGCRELMQFFAKQGGDPRFAVLPGVLHAEPVWGGGTTEYALEAIQAAAKGEEYVCPIEPHVVMPMIYVTDLMNGLIALQDAPADQLQEPQQGYCIPGLSFSAEELFAEIRRHKPEFRTTVKLDENMNKFANLWPDNLCEKAPRRDLGYSPKVGLREMVAHVLVAQEERLARSKIRFRVIDEDNDGQLTRTEMKDFLSQTLHVPYGISDDVKAGLCEELVERAFSETGCSEDGCMSYPTFHNWTKRTSIYEFVHNFAEEKEYLWKL